MRLESKEKIVSSLFTKLKKKEKVNLLEKIILETKPKEKPISSNAANFNLEEKRERLMLSEEELEMGRFEQENKKKRKDHVRMTKDEEE